MSTSRECFIYKAIDQQWYMNLGDFEHAWDHEDCTTYGPFDSEEAVEKELDFHSNPGGSSTCASGTRPVPTKSGNGLPVQPPTRHRWPWERPGYK